MSCGQDSRGRRRNELLGARTGAGFPRAGPGQGPCVASREATLRVGFPRAGPGQGPCRGPVLTPARRGLAPLGQVGFRSKYDKEIPLNEGEDAEAAWKMFSLRQARFCFPSSPTKSPPHQNGPPARIPFVPSS